MVDLRGREETRSTAGMGRRREVAEGAERAVELGLGLGAGGDGDGEAVAAADADVHLVGDDRSPAIVADPPCPFPRCYLLLHLHHRQISHCFPPPQFPFFFFPPPQKKNEIVYLVRARSVRSSEAMDQSIQLYKEPRHLTCSRPQEKFPGWSLISFLDGGPACLAGQV